ncbi:hypothetical protein BDAP_001513 [Binucleata daphniae]
MKESNKNFRLETKNKIKQFDDEKMVLVFAESSLYKNVTMKIKESKNDFDKFMEITKKVKETVKKQNRMKKQPQVIPYTEQVKHMKQE